MLIPGARSHVVESDFSMAKHSIMDGSERSVSSSRKSGLVRFQHSLAQKIQAIFSLPLGSVSVVKGHPYRP